MLRQVNRETVGAVVSRVFAQAAFLFPEPADAPPPLAADDRQFLRVGVRFEGTRSGLVELILPVELCTEIAANMLGTDPESAALPDYREDAARELVNIITGQLLTELYGGREKFRQSPPSIVQLTPDYLAAVLESPDLVCVLVDESPVLVTCTETKGAYEHQGVDC